VRIAADVENGGWNLICRFTKLQREISKNRIYTANIVVIDAINRFTDAVDF